MKTNNLIKWVIANGLGLGIGFVLFLQIGMTLRYGFDTNKYWQFGQAWDFSIYEYIRRLISSFTYGAIFGSAQYVILNSINTRIKFREWVLVTAVGAMFWTVLIDWPLLFLELGNLPGPLDPIMVTLLGGSFMGVAQYFYLRKLGFNPKKWLLWWVIGLFISIIPSALFFTFIGSQLNFSWPMEVFISGFIAAAVAAWLSGKSFFNTILNLG